MQTCCQAVFLQYYEGNNCFSDYKPALKYFKAAILSPSVSEGYGGPSQNSLWDSWGMTRPQWHVCLTSERPDWKGARLQGHGRHVHADPRPAAVSETTTLILWPNSHHAPLHIKRAGSASRWETDPGPSYSWGPARAQPVKRLPGQQEAMATCHLTVTII